MIKTKRDWKPIIQDWEKSGLSQGAFCKEKGINKNTFNSAVKAERKRKTGTKEEKDKAGFYKIHARSENLEPYRSVVTLIIDKRIEVKISTLDNKEILEYLLTVLGFLPCSKI